jgi:hypothetical protein
LLLLLLFMSVFVDVVVVCCGMSVNYLSLGELCWQFPS